MLVAGRMSRIMTSWFNELAKLLYDIWMKADCSRMNIRNIRRTFEGHVWEGLCKIH